MSDRRRPYPEHAAFIRPAWGRPQLWRVLVVMIGFEATFLISPILVEAFLPTPEAVLAYRLGTSTSGTLAQFFTFAINAILFLALLRVVHRRGFWSLIGRPRAAARNLKVVAIAVALVLFSIEILPPWINISELAEVRDFLTWLGVIPVALIALLIQTGTEEIYFRGYLQQQLACISPSRWVWMGFPSLLFGIEHYANGNGPSEAVVMVIWATLLAVACADLTARTGNIGAAIGLHMSNNAFALLIVGVQGWPSSGLALFLYPWEDPQSYDYDIQSLAQPWAIMEILTMACTVLVMWLAARIAIRR